MKEKKIGKIEKVYETRMHIFLSLLEKNNPDWITKKKWFDELAIFELGDNAYKTFFVIDSEIDEDLYSIVMNGLTKAKDFYGNDKDIGLEIDTKLCISLDEEDHQRILDYLWWNKIFTLGKEKNNFTSEQIKELENIKKYLEKNI